LKAQNIDTVQFHPKDTLVVGVAGSAPFIYTDSTGTNSGVAYEIWENVSNALDWNYTTQNFKSVPEGLNAVRSGKIDVLVGPISITSDRTKFVDFSQPYYYSGQAIM